METETNPGIYACAVCPNFKPTAEIRGYKEHMRYISTLILIFFRELLGLKAYGLKPESL
jgi:hypothetical protein